MAHTSSGVDPYRRLQERLDRMVTGAPDSPALRAILRRLFSPEEAELAVRMPTLCSVRSLAERLGRDEGELSGVIDGMASRGLVVDLEHRGKRWVMLAPVVIGFFEYTFMRVGEQAPDPELVELFDEYLYGEPDRRLAHAVFRGSVQIGRSLVREEALPEDSPVEVLDWERATSVIRSADRVAVAPCPCRAHARLAGHGCDAPLKTCLSFDAAADALVRMGLAESISTEEGLAVLAEAKAAGLAQTADNVQHGVTYMCNCCGCCCGMMQAIRGAGITQAIVSSNWVAETDFANCRGCKKCFRRCPTDAITMVDNQGKGRRVFWAIVDPDKCLGCGVCAEACRWEGRVMAPRAHRHFTPETTIDRMIAMAVERGRLGDLLLDTLTGTGPRAVARMLQVLEKTPPVAAVRAIEPLRSVFLRGLLAAVHVTTPSGAVP
jgi:formate hydrogenlyase subunit 6/NADH:ubiquinone oxidoreductase subunit I